MDYLKKELNEVFTEEELKDIKLASGPIFYLPGKVPVVCKPKEFDTLEELKQYVLENKDKLWVFIIVKVFDKWKLLRHE